MDGGEFFDRVEAHPDLEGLGIEEAEGDKGPAAHVRHVPSGGKFRVELSAIADQDWDTLLSIFQGRRQPRVLSHMTRVVGYFSKIENWNRSKVGELKGRQCGDYSLETERTAEGR
jgi:hypothetical protein